MNIKAKIYYDNEKGDVLLVTPAGYVKETTEEEDFKNYKLKDKNKATIDKILLSERELKEILFIKNVKYYKVNLETKQLKVIYYTEEELKEMQQENQATENLNNRISDISSYLVNSGEKTISKIENTILETEKNKVLNENGGI
ncbi:MULTISPECIES: hypothetical protein [unclassified Clostridium]|uniref:hypothetical protein n=1 Tax=unclassified Clostridium TaxID=2614128 RepID=UPI00207AED8A|nr:MULTISPECIES: hypothetical protein [unclassified Clostridium]